MSPIGTAVFSAASPRGYGKTLASEPEHVRTFKAEVQHNQRARVAAIRAQRKDVTAKVEVALDVEVITCRFSFKRAQRYIRIQLFPSTFKWIPALNDFNVNA
jgi:hypothetical protein